MNLRKQGLLKLALFVVTFSAGLQLSAAMPATMATNIARFMDFVKWSQTANGVNVLRTRSVIWSADDQATLLANLNTVVQQLNMTTTVDTMLNPASPKIPLIAKSSQFWNDINGYAKGLTMSLFSDLYTYYTTTNLSSYPVLTSSLSVVLTMLQGSARAMPNSFNQAFGLQNKVGVGLSIPTSIEGLKISRGGSSMSATLSKSVSSAAKY